MKARPSFEKRRKEMQRQERNKDKAERRKSRRDERQKPDSPTDGVDPAGVDPDIAHIVWGPQPTAEDEAIKSGGASGKEAAPAARGSRKAGEGTSSKDGIGVSK